jgi:predicted small lipoprotein YifL
VAPSSRRYLYRAAVVGLALAVVGVAGCGRRGPLEPPSLANSVPATAAKPAGAPAVPERPFVLDRLL